MKNLLETNKKSRMSLNSQYVQINDTNFVDLKNLPPSQSTIQNNNPDVFTNQELHKAFNFISKGNQYIQFNNLIGFLQEQGQNLYIGTEMILLLDSNRKGYVTREQFINLFQKNIYDCQPILSEELEKDRKLVTFIENNQDLLNYFTDPQYCQYVNKKIKLMEQEKSYD